MGQRHYIEEQEFMVRRRTGNIYHALSLECYVNDGGLPSFDIVFSTYNHKGKITHSVTGVGRDRAAARQRYSGRLNGCRRKFTAINRG